MILIIVAIVGAIAVGLIVSRVSTDTSGQANVQGAATGTQGTLLIGGSTTVYPIELALQAGFQSQYKINLVLSQGGSDAGMQGVISGALNIGAASSTGAVNNAETDVVNNDIQGVTINPTLIGGSAVVVVENGASTVAASTPALGGFITDTGVAIGNTCDQITKAALKEIFTLGTFYIETGACGTSTGAANNGPAGQTATLDFPTSGAGTTAASMVGVATAGYAGPFHAVSRSDNSGTQDQFATYVGLPKQSAAGNFPGVTEQGNAGVLNYVNTNTNTIGFVDLGFAEGAASGATCPTGHATATTCGVAMPQVDTNSPAVAGVDAATTVPAAGTNGYVQNSASAGVTAAEGSTTNVHNLILAALKKAAFVNPLTLAGQIAEYPDTAATGTGLARTFYFVTNGTPTLTEENFLSYATNYNQEAAYTSNGYFSQYDMTSA